ncbi:MAG: DUF2294 family protein [Nitrospiraceae bacterium]|nr:DUF2294 family protein [Nitrospiraceae bacterium]
MRDSETKEEQVLQAVARFEREQMDLSPSSILVNLQCDTVYVMLQGMTFPAERACAGDEHGQEMIEQYHARIFDAGKHTLESEIQGILGRSVERSTMRVEPVFGNGVIQFTLGKTTGKREGRPQ